MIEKEKPERVFIRVEGRLVPKPGNNRDPNRRYSGTSSPEYPGETIHVEFTPEEEKARDEEEAKWKAERPIREAESRRRQEEWDKFLATVVYSNRIVAFIDVLGWSALMQETIRDPSLVTKLGGLLQSQYQFHEWQYQFEAQAGDKAPARRYDITQFSDSIILSCTTDTGVHEVDWHLSSICHGFRSLGLFVRGGITFGPIYHNRNIAFGPALVEAYNLEQQAKYPRIIVRHDLGRLWRPGTRYMDTSGKTLGYQKTWRTDSDGWVFYDFLQPGMASTLPDRSPPHARRHFEYERKGILKGLSENLFNQRTYEKYSWLANYFNNVLKEYPDCADLVIDIP